MLGASPAVPDEAPPPDGVLTGEDRFDVDPDVGRGQQTLDLSMRNWPAVSNRPVVTNLENQVVLSPAPSGNTFYRLWQ